MAEDALDAGAAVVAGEEDEVGVVDALHHHERLVEAGDHLGPLVEVLEQQVPHRPVRLVDDDLRGAAVERSRDGRVHVLGEQPAKALVGRLALLHVDDVRDAG